MIGDPRYLNVWIRNCKKIFLYKKKVQLSRTGSGNQRGERNVILTQSKSRHIHPLEFLCCWIVTKLKNKIPTGICDSHTRMLEWIHP